ncbi:MAG: hypothetical protein GEU74_12400 [Nitriliruptorales bacterium]|nr:hypothetical protein [Nitriliruptorales bacterium]
MADRGRHRGRHRHRCRVPENERSREAGQPVRLGQGRGPVLTSTISLAPPGGRPVRDGPGHVTQLPDYYTALDAAYVAAIVRGDDTEAGRLATVLDTPRREVGGIATGSAALWYARQGWPAFPLLPSEKRPLPGSRGLKDATTDEDQIRDWWETTPDANIGLRTGDVFDVFDFDGGETSALAFRDMTLDGDFPPIRGIVLTPRGMHLYVTATGRANKTDYLPGVDHRGAGGYVVAPPSRITTGAYVWLLPPEGK